MKDHPGEGIALRSMTFEGPLLDGDMWPPVGTRRLLQGVEFDETGEVGSPRPPTSTSWRLSRRSRRVRSAGH